MENAEITLRDVTRENYRECLRLRVAPEQELFVASNAVSLAEAKYEPGLVPLAIYAGERMVGFAMYGYDEEEDAYWIHRLMIDESFQRRGYGRAALRALLARLRALPDCRQVAISWDPSNTVAERLYLSEGFVKTGEIIWNEAVGRLTVRS